MKVVILIGLIGCGRWNFDSKPDAGDRLTDDAPRLPTSLVCHASQVNIPAITAGTGLAIARSTNGYEAAWANNSAVTGVAIDPQLTPGPISEMILTEAVGVAGLVETPTNVLVVTTNAAGQELWSLSKDLTAPMRLRSDTSKASREPFASDQAGKPRIWVRGTAGALVTSYIHDAGGVDVDGIYPTEGPVTAISADDGPDHSHLTWAVDLGGGLSRCFASDVRYTMPTPPTPSGSPLAVSDDCFDVRTASGPPAADSMIVVWRTAGHLIEARYLANGGNFMRDMSLHGRAPKVGFDGSEFWISWIEEGEQDELHLASFDLAGNVKDVTLTGWMPVGDEAFGFVRRGASLHLVVLRANTLDFLLTCA